ncbi:MAG: phosphatase PAP2 family protein [Acidobacteria bacterium]|nr:phosphatase PAP2 family protein [Acidobacteriota bacterium]
MSADEGRQAAAERGVGSAVTRPRGAGGGWLVSLWQAFRRLRPEEALFVVGFVPSSIVTVYAISSLQQDGLSVKRIEAGLLRLSVAVLLAATIPLIDRSREWLAWRPRLAAAAEFYRTMLPFVLCIAVYTNLHDTVRFVNPNDIHHHLVAIEEWIFGGQPVVWAEQFITRGRTEFFSMFYSSFFLIAPSVVIVLWASGKRVEAREVLLGVILCFYTGYLLYVIFPAAPPRLYLESLGMFEVNLRGGPIMNFQASLIDMMPNHASRAAFPSLHAGVSIVALHYAWRYCRWYFPILLVVVTGLLVATVYLRHHYVVDLIAGALLLPWVVWLTPRFDRWWRGVRS